MYKRIAATLVVAAFAGAQPANAAVPDLDRTPRRSSSPPMAGGGCPRCSVCFSGCCPASAGR